MLIERVVVDWLLSNTTRLLTTLLTTSTSTSFGFTAEDFLLFIKRYNPETEAISFVSSIIANSLWTVGE